MERRPTWMRSARTGLRVSVVMLVCLPLFAVAAGATATWMLLYGDLPVLVPKPNPQIVAQPSQVYDTQGNLIGVFRQFDISKPISREDVPQILKEAVVAAEDRNFWDHEGVDPLGVVRAAIENVEEGETVQGGSTITQQYIKKTYLSSERTVERKLNEAILAARLEQELSKEEILWRYLDGTYFGGGAYGVGAAAETYFRKSVRDLTASESATLAAVIPAPSRYGPRENPAVTEERRKNILRIMFEEGYLDEAEYTEAKEQVLWPSIFGPPPGPATVFEPPPDKGAFAHPYFVDYVERYLVDKYGPDLVYRGGLDIRTTIDPALQAMAEESVRAETDTMNPDIDMSMVSVEPSTGQVKALVGGRDWNVSQVNLALNGDLGGSAGFQPGSSFKTFTLVTALEQGYSPDTIYPAPGVWRIPGCTGTKCSVRGGTGGSITLRQATAGSVNTVYAQLAFDVGPNNIAEVANRLGIETLGTEPYNPERDFNFTITLGSYEVSPLDMAAAYAVLANHGVRAPATPILKLTQPDGTVLEDNTQPHGERVLHPAVADWTTELLTGVVNGGTGERAAIGRPVAGKTGSAQENKAAWFVGYTPQLATSVWIGYPKKPTPLRRVNGFGLVYGGTIPARTFARFMKRYHEGLPVENFPQPGFLPAPSGDVRMEPDDRMGIGELARDCGGPCDRTPVLTSPPSTTTTLPPEGEGEGTEAPPESSTTTTTLDFGEDDTADFDDPTTGGPP